MSANKGILHTYSELNKQQPLLFIPNHGQAETNVSFIAEKLGYYVGISAREVCLTLCKPNESWIGLHLSRRFIDASPNATVEGLEKEAGTFHYFMGAGAASRFMNLPPYRKVICRELWPGIDVVIHEGVQSLKYDWIVRPHGRTEAIRMSCEGCIDMRLDENGSLIIDTEFGLLAESKPMACQKSEEDSFPVSCHYRLCQESDGRKSIGFEFPEGYDQELELVIRSS